MSLVEKYVLLSGGKKFVSGHEKTPPMFSARQKQVVISGIGFLTGEMTSNSTKNFSKNIWADRLVLFTLHHVNSIPLKKFLKKRYLKTANCLLRPAKINSLVPGSWLDDYGIFPCACGFRTYLHIYQYTCKVCSVMLWGNIISRRKSVEQVENKGHTFTWDVLNIFFESRRLRPTFTGKGLSASTSW